jgi:hypothetical protein
MAEIVLGIASSHSPQLSVPADQWHLLREKDEHDARLDYQGLLRRAKPDIAGDLTANRMRERHEACQRAIAILGGVLQKAAADVIVIFGDDQHEQFSDDNMPTFALYRGESLPVIKQSGRNAAAWKTAEERGWAETAQEYPVVPQLAEHLIRSLVADEFDMARCDRFREEIGVGHAFSFLYRRILPGAMLPMLPVMVNTYYPPNQPTPKRCYALGQAVRRAIESWAVEARVAVMASGGLSHVVIDEELDRNVIDALIRRDRELLYSVPRDKLRGGTSEILNWIALAGAVEPMEMKLVDYVTTYRSPAGTGCGMAFAYWDAPKERTNA